MTYHGRLGPRLQLGMRVAMAVTAVITEPVHPDEAVIENSLRALDGAPGLIWTGELNQRSFSVVLVCHL